MKFEDIRSAMKVGSGERVASNGWASTSMDVFVDSSPTIYTPDYIRVRYVLNIGVEYTYQTGDGSREHSKDNAARQIMKCMYGDVETKLQRLCYGVSCGEFTAQETADKLHEIIRELQ